MVDQRSREEHERREDELAQFFADRPEDLDFKPARGALLAKVVLPLLALVLLGVIIAWPLLSKQEASVTLSYSALEKSGDEIRMEEPRYLGTDARNRPFEIAASVAVQQGVNARQINLEGVRASLRLAGGDDVSAAATSGIYIQEEERLELSRGIRIHVGGGYSFAGEHMILNLNEGTGYGDGRVSGEGPFGRFEADTFTFDVSGRSVALEGGVRVNLTPGQGEPGQDRNDTDDDTTRAGESGR